MADFVELGAEGTNHFVDKHWGRIYDTAHVVKQRVVDPKDKDDRHDDSKSNQGGGARKQRNQLPSPEGDRSGVDYYRERDKENYSAAGRTAASRRDRRRSSSLERQSETSERVIYEYERERDDPRRKPESVLSKSDLKKLRRDSKMSHANGGTLPPGSHVSGRAHSQQPPPSRYYDDDEESDYDERTGRRYKARGRGYDDRDDYDDRGYDREVITTERYQGVSSGALVPARPDFRGRENSYNTSRTYGQNDPYGAGAVTQYRRSQADLAEYGDDKRSRRSQSRGRSDKYKRDRSDSRSRSRSRSSSRHSGIRGKIDDTFDTSLRGLGVGLAGAVAGGLAGRQFGQKHKNRDILLGALVGGLGANAVENKWNDYREGKKERESEYRSDIGRSRSAMR